MRGVPLSYPLRSLAVRWQAALFSALGIAMTVAVLCGIFALRSGFQVFMNTTGSDEVAVFLRPGATSEGESGIAYEDVELIKKSRPEIRRDEAGRPLAAGEAYLALWLDKRDGSGSVNVPIRGVEPQSFAIQGDKLRMVDGTRFAFGTNQLIVGKPLVERIANCEIGDTLVINVTPFEVVGIFEHEGAYRSELWGDVDRIAAALERPIRQRVIARLVAGTDVEALAAEMADDKRLPSKVQSERAYFASQTRVLGDVLWILGVMLTTILGAAAVLGAMNTMLAAVGSRTREIGVLRALGFSSSSILVAFLIESLLIGLVGGVIGSVLVLPLDGLQTGTMNWNTFTETAFAFRVDGELLGTAILVAGALGLVGGLLPAWRASRLRPVEALRRT